MAKNKKRKNIHALFHAVQKKRSTDNNHNNNSNSNSNNVSLGSTGDDPATATAAVAAVVSDADMATTVNVINIILAADPDLLQSKACKDLRRALHPLILRQLQNYEPVDYLKRVTLALMHQKWSDAMAALQGARDYQQLPKQGTIQRWVRDADGAGDCKMKLLSAMLRLGNTVSSENKHDVGQVMAKRVAAGEDLTILEGWTVPNSDATTELELDLELELPTPRELESRIVYQEEAASRTPPNMHDLLLHATLPGYMTYSDTPPPVIRHDIPFLQGGFLLDRVLTSSECHQLKHAATQLGFRPDHPSTANKPTGIDSCEWFVDHSITHELFRRVQPHLPPTMQGHALHNLNARFRCFRYAQDCVYRPHIDGSWPESRLDVDGNYDCGAGAGAAAGQPCYAKSFLTFLMYLNDNFEGGETRFYMPTEDGMVARGVVPKRGAVLVFPQGNMCSLIHEGSAVTSGTKYVIRTDVLYRQQEDAPVERG
jgi:hypothetical protein